MARIGVIAPEPKAYRNIPSIALELGIANSIELHLATMDEGLSIARTMEREGVDVIVSRGATVELILGAGIRTPVVNIPLSVQDLSNALSSVHELTGLARPRIAVVTYTQIDWDLKAFASLLDMDLDLHLSCNNRDAVLSAVRKALADKVDVVMGGITSERALRGTGVPFILLESGKPSLRQALSEAKQIAYARALEQTQTQRFKAVVEASSDGILALDQDGTIRMVNPAADRILNLPTTPLGRPAQDVFPLPELQACLLTGKASTADVVQRGGQSYLVSIVPTVLRREVTGAVVTFQPVRRIEEMEAKIRYSRTKGLLATHTFQDIVGLSPAMQTCVKQARRYARASDTILLLGETGTGKELFAQAIHNLSARAKGPFVAVNCAALPPTLLESEFFGYEEGAFTGANRHGKPGLFELAHEGTIFLDEVAAMDHYGQTRLLRVLQEKSVMRLGGHKYQPVDFTVIAASNVDLAAHVAQGNFRNDLFYRLLVFPLRVPPLRERASDIPHLARQFARSFASRFDTEELLDASAIKRLQEHAWPGNVRELKHCIQRICLLLDTPPATAAHVETALAFSVGIARPSICPDVASQPAEDAVTQAQRRQVLEVLRACDGNQGRAAAELGMSRSTLYRKMRRLGIQRTCA